MDSVNIPANFEVRSFARPRDNRGYSRNLGSPVYAHAPFSPKLLKGFCSDGPRNYLPKLNFIALRIPEIMGGTQKIW